MPQIEVTFDIDANGIVQVSARTSDQQGAQIRIQASGGLSDGDIDKMSRTPSDAAEDKKRRELVEARPGDALIHTMSAPAEAGDKVPAESANR